jgi:multidrug efflux system outer membrane protein
MSNLFNKSRIAGWLDQSKRHVSLRKLNAQVSKAAEDSRTPGPVGLRTSLRLRDSVLECGCPLPLFLIPQLFRKLPSGSRDMLKRSVGLIGILVLTGCASFTERRSPAQDEGVPAAPASFAQSNATTSPSAASSSEPWWRVFKEPALDSLIERLNDANPDIEAALARIDQSFAILGITRGALLPTVLGDASAGRRRDSVNNLLFPIATPEYARYRIGVGASWEIDLWGRVRGGVKRDRLTAESSELQFKSQLLSLQANLARQYFAIQSAEAELGILREAVVIREENLKLQQSRLQLGSGVEVDVARARVEALNAKASEEAAVRSLGKLRHAIAALVGVAPSGFKDSLANKNGAKPMAQTVPAGVPSSLLERRADLRAADRTLRAAAIQVGVRKSDFLPTITLTGSGGLASLKASSLFSTDSGLFDIGPQIDVPIFQAGARKSAVAQAQAQWREAAANYRGALLTAVREVDDALLDIKSLKSESTVRHAAVNAATQAAQAATRRHDSGLASYFEVLDAERERLQARLMENILLGERQAAAVSLIQALGGSW